MSVFAIVYYMACGDVELTLYAREETVTLTDLEPSDALIISALSEATTAKESHASPLPAIVSIETWYFD